MSYSERKWRVFEKWGKGDSDGWYKAWAGEAKFIQEEGAQRRHLFRKGTELLAGAVGKLTVLWSNLKDQTQFEDLILCLLQNYTYVSILLIVLLFYWSPKNRNLYFLSVLQEMHFTVGVWIIFFAIHLVSIKFCRGEDIFFDAFCLDLFHVVVIIICHRVQYNVYHYFFCIIWSYSTCWQHHRAVCMGEMVLPALWDGEESAEWLKARYVNISKLSNSTWPYNFSEELFPNNWILYKNTQISNSNSKQPVDLEC